MPTDFWEEDGSQEPQTNAVGKAGFILSILGILTCGILSPFSLVLSLIGLGKEPKATAKGGVLLSLLGCLTLIPAAYFGYQVFDGAREEAQVLRAALNASALLQDETGDASQLSAEMKAKILQDNLDPWSKPFSYVQLDGEFELLSAGADGEFSTSDDSSWIFPNVIKNNERQSRKGR